MEEHRCVYCQIRHEPLTTRGLPARFRYITGLRTRRRLHSCNKCNDWHKGRVDFLTVKLPRRCLK